MSGMMRICEEAGDRRIGLARAKFEVCVFGIPTGDGRIMLRNGLIGVSSRHEEDSCRDDFGRSPDPLPEARAGKIRAAKTTRDDLYCWAIQALNRCILSIGGIGAE